MKERKKLASIVIATIASSGLVKSKPYLCTKTSPSDKVFSTPSSRIRMIDPFKMILRSLNFGYDAYTPTLSSDSHH